MYLGKNAAMFEPMPCILMGILLVWPKRSAADRTYEAAFERMGRARPDVQTLILSTIQQSMNNTKTTSLKFQVPWK